MKVYLAGDSHPLLNQEFISKAVDFIVTKIKDRSISQLEGIQSITIALVNPLKMQDLNKTFRKKDKVTDILSFAPVEEGSLGELALCVDQIIQQSQEHELTLEEESIYLILHGILHLLGYDHEKDKQEARLMYEIQDGIFSDWLNRSK